MRHQRKRGKLSRDPDHRRALLANLSKEVIEHERITTSEAKAKAVKPELEKLITLAKRGDLHARRQALSALGQDTTIVHLLFEVVAPRYVDRSGGYTRILKMEPRPGDSADMALMQLVEEAKAEAEKPADGKKGRAKRAKKAAPEAKDEAAAAPKRRKAKAA